MLINKATSEANNGANPAVYEIDNPEKATYQITDTKFYVSVITLSKKKKKKKKMT